MGSELSLNNNNDKDRHPLSQAGAGWEEGSGEVGGAHGSGGGGGVVGGESDPFRRSVGRKLVSFSTNQGGSLGGVHDEDGSGGYGSGGNGDDQEDWVQSGVVLPQLTEQQQAVAAASAKLEQVSLRIGIGESTTHLYNANEHSSLYQ